MLVASGDTALCCPYLEIPSGKENILRCRSLYRQPLLCSSCSVSYRPASPDGKKPKRVRSPARDETPPRYGMLLEDADGLMFITPVKTKVACDSVNVKFTPQWDGPDKFADKKVHFNSVVPFTIRSDKPLKPPPVKTHEPQAVGENHVYRINFAAETMMSCD